MARQVTIVRSSPGEPTGGGAASKPVLWRPLSGWVSTLTLAVLVLLVLWVWRDVRIGRIFSDSMVPTLVRGDFYVIRLDAYRKSAPRRGDIVVIKHPEGKELLIKRVIGVGGDMVGVFAGRVILNDQLVEEPYIASRPGIREWPTLTQVPEGRLFLLGDNRNFSEDSRDLGTLPARNVVGRVAGIILPLEHRRHFGDPFSASQTPPPGPGTTPAG